MRLPATPIVPVLAPCKLLLDSTESADTRTAPFVEGTNQLEVCTRDYGTPGAEVCDLRSVRVDNVAPAARFSAAQRRDDPELIRVLTSDRTSGVGDGEISFRAVGESTWRPLPTELVAGELRARVDSQSEPAGRYEFRAVARDVAGNQATTGAREDGEPMVLDFPLKTGTRLVAHLPGGVPRSILRYRDPSRVAGRLRDASGRAIGGAEVVVTERFDRGSLIDRRVRRVTTDPDGSFRSFLPGGPSRRVRVAYSGSPRYIDDSARALDLNVRSAAALRTSRRRVRAGRAVTFRGHVKRYFARIPAGGKLVELQVRERGGKWNTVREAFTTNARGWYRLRYRFGNFYVRRTSFRFRVKVTREAGWPYRAPVRSRARKVTIVPRG